MCRKFIFTSLFLLNLTVTVFAQFSGQNLSEYQFGRLPDETESSFSGLYNRSSLDFSLRNFKVGGTLEQFYTPFSARNYTKINQFRLNYNSKAFDFKVGNFYETLGRGLLLRSYEIPGAILEDKSYRSRHYFHRDLLGASATIRLKNLHTKILYAKPLINVLPPTFDAKDRRQDQVSAIQTDFTIKKQKVGGAILYLNNNSEKSWYAMANASGHLFPFLSYYTELAKNLSNHSIVNFSNDVSYAYYGNLNLFFDRFGLSAEYKNYNNFLLGSGFNEPPALVKEHSYKVLNRSTHVLQPQNEKGFQLEAFLNFSNESVLTMNFTRAVNNFGKKYVFQEYFAEYSFSLKEKHEMKLFADLAQDPFKLEMDRFSSGFYADWKLNSSSSFNSSYEFQTFSGSTSSVINQVVSVGISIKSKFSGYLISEWSNDPVVVEKDYNIWLGGGLKYKIGSRHNLQFFAGERRGGPACNSGVCYEVLDFRGIELRLSSRF